MNVMTINSAMNYAYICAAVSSCYDKQVGCVILDENRAFLSAGCNISCKQPKCLKKQGKECTAIHAEIIALKYVDIEIYQPYIAVCTLEPCFKCAKALYSAGVREIYFHKKTSAQKSGMIWFNGQKGCIARQINYKCEIEVKSQKSIEVYLTANESKDKPINWATLFTDIRQYHRDGSCIAEYRRTPLITALQKQQLRDMVLALTDEAHEALHEADWKPWKKYGGRPKVNPEKFLEETGDILFFIDGMLMTFGLSWDDLASAVEKKLKVARERLANGYHD